jgi:magnesium chelatase subunit H
MPKPTSAAEKTGSNLRVVLVTMDTHLASAAQRSAAALTRQLPGLCFNTHSASEYRTNENALQRCNADIARADP